MFAILSILYQSNNPTIQQLQLSHPSDIKYTKALEKRQRVAKGKGCFVNPLFFQARIARLRRLSHQVFDA
jgi:hypothetical protein